MKNKEQLNNKALRVVERIIRNGSEKAKFEWPPLCVGIGHQPKRPKRKEN